MKIIQKLTAMLIISAIIACAFSFGALGASSVKGSEVANFALGLEGCGYQYSCKGPEKFDCSGLVYYVLNNFGITFGNSTLEYNTAEKAKAFGTVINSIEDAEAGDIVVWKSHTAVYLGNGECIAAMNPRKGVVINQVEKFIDKNGVKNPEHFFIRPFDYAEETAENTAPEAENTSAESAENKKLGFTDKIRLMLERIAEFIKAPFMPVINAFK
ncbi:MAG: C40 family peptidase [Clostridia bacterium]|nr:C40 family peptidase [Clostridia bacterium]